LHKRTVLVRSVQLLLSDFMTATCVWDRPLGEVVGSMQSGAAQKGEQGRLLVAQVVGQPLIVRAAKMPI
jgi:hypothetical protein